MAADVRPGWKWRWARRATQLLALAVLVTAPLLGGWQRMDRTEMARWDNTGFDLPGRVRAQLPLGERPKQAYSALELTGGGTALRAFSIPAVDPVVGVPAATRGGWSWTFALALLLPLLVAVLAGRWFCGWLCPFGSLSRAVQSLLSRLPVRPPRYAIPARRPLRWAILAGTLVASGLGVQLVLIYVLPHLLVQQSVYSVWLLGGGGAVVGALAGLVIAGIAFGPTLYCATVCPTGAALSACGNLRSLRVTLVDAAACGAHCSLCDRACWLGLKPSSGDPGPDCDVCARCFVACPHANMQVSARRPGRRHLPVVAAALLSLSLAARAAEAAPRRALTKPTLVLNGERTYDGVTVAVSIEDVSGVKLDADSRRSLHGIVLTVFIARGKRGAAGPTGLLRSRDVYRGPLRVHVWSSAGAEVADIAFAAPTSPRSAPNRTLFRKRVHMRVQPGDRITLGPIKGWLAREVSWRVATPGTSRSTASSLLLVLGAALGYAGLLSLAVFAGLWRSSPTV